MQGYLYIMNYRLQRPIADLSVSGVPPAYTERRWQIEISAQQRKDFDDLLERSPFFKFQPAWARMLQMVVTWADTALPLIMNSRNHTVEFSDSSITQELADLMKFLKDAVR